MATEYSSIGNLKTKRKGQKMKKVLSLLLCLTLLCSMFALPTAAYTTTVRRTDKATMATALKELGLFRGVSDTDFALEREMTRVEAMVMLLRVMGCEADALADNLDHPFEDTPKWADAYLGYAYRHQLTYGISETQFGTGNASAAAFLTLMLRALGYSDAGEADFAWDDPFPLARQIGILDGTVSIADFRRGDAVTVAYYALFAYIKGAKTTLADKLIAQGLFTDAAFDAAIEKASAAAGTSGSLVGLSAYDIAVKNGFVGTEKEWLASLVGARGSRGSSGANGKDGKDGVDGKDGKDGVDGKDGINGLTPFIGANGNWWIGETDTGISAQGLKGDQGDKGDTGAQGIQGEKGEKGDKGDTGAQGIQGEKGDTGAQGIQGDKGDKGDAGADGRDGADGRGIESAEIVNGELILHYTDGTSDNLGKITGTSDDASPSEWFNFRAINPNEFEISIKDEFKNLPEKLIIPSEYAGIPVTSIADKGFRDCQYLQEVYVPASIAVIGDYAFVSCKNLETVTLPEGLLSIGLSAFKNTGLTYLEIPATVTSVEGSICGEVSLLGNESDAASFSPLSALVFKEVSGWAYSRIYGITFSTMSGYKVTREETKNPIAQETVSDSALMAQLLTGKAKYNGDDLRNCTFYRTTE